MSWPLVELGEIGEFKAGFGFPNILQGKKTGDVPFAKVGDISTIARAGKKYISSAGNYLDTNELPLIKAKTLPKGTIVFAKIGEAIRQNFRVVTDVEILIDNNAMGLIPNLNLIDVDYLYHFMCRLNLYNYADATTVPALRKSVLEKIEIPLPPLEEQKRIAAILDKADNICRKRQQAIKLADEFLRAVFMDMFGDPVENTKGWDFKNLKELSTKIHSGNTPTGGREVYVDKGIAFFRSQNVWKNKLELSDIAYLDIATHKKMAKSSLKNRDILMTKTGRINTENSSLGRAAMYLGEDDAANINGHVYLIRLKNPELNEFILYILTTREYRDYIRSVCVGGIDKRQLNKDHLEQFPIINPPIELQKQFVKLMQTVESKKKKAQQGFQESQKLFNTLSQKAFTGKL